MYPRANLMGLLALLGSPGSPFYWNRLRLCCCTLTLCLTSHIFCNCKCAYKYKSGTIHIYNFINVKVQYHNLGKRIHQHSTYTVVHFKFTYVTDFF